MSDPSTDDTMEFAIDDVTGLLLRARSSNGKLPAEVIDVEIYEHLPDTTFDWDGEIAPPSENERHRHPDHLRKVHFLAQEIAPRYWPTGVDVQPVVGDPHTGEVVASLTVDGHPPLARWPRQAQPTLIAPELASRYRHSVEWSDDHWQWRLMTATPITQGDWSRFVTPSRDDGLMGRRLEGCGPTHIHRKPNHQRDDSADNARAGRWSSRKRIRHWDTRRQRKRDNR